MKTIDQIIENYKEYGTFLEDRFGKRLCQFLTIEQMERIGFRYTDETATSNHVVIPFTEENVIAQLKNDVEFGWEKACDERGISASLMFDVVIAWCKVLENGLHIDAQYNPYGKPLFKDVAEKYGFELEED